MLQPQLSLSIFNDADHKEKNQQAQDEDKLERTVTIGETIGDIDFEDGFSFTENDMDLIEEKEGEDDDEDEDEEVKPARTDRVKFLSAADFQERSGDGDEYYKKMIKDYPSHPLLLSNYAQLLQSKGNHKEAEEYYLQAIKADPDPKDGQILFKYANLMRELHQDQAKVLNYYERAVQTVPHDSEVLAAYASFLWEMEDDKESNQDDIKTNETEPVNRIGNLAASEKGTEQVGPSLNSTAAMTSATDYEKLLKENPNDPTVLRNYAGFLFQSKGDLQGAEEYYARAIGASPKDGGILSEYARLVWDCRRDHGQASSYFEKAVEATRGDPHVLAAYARFLWETDEEKENGVRQDQQ